MVAMGFEIGDILAQLSCQDLVAFLQLDPGRVMVVVENPAQLDAVADLVDPGIDFIELDLKFLPIAGHAFHPRCDRVASAKSSSLCWSDVNPGRYPVWLASRAGVGYHHKQAKLWRGVP